MWFTKVYWMQILLFRALNVYMKTKEAEASWDIGTESI